MPMQETATEKICSNSRGFSLLEVLLGISVFMIGMLGVTALNISSMKSSAFSGNLSDATIVAASKLEELMTVDFDDIVDDPAGVKDDGNSGENQDEDDDGMDDDNPLDTDAGVAHDDDINFGLDDCPSCNGDDADYSETVVKNNITYNVYWNVAEKEPVSQGPQRTKRINVIVVWFVKDEPRSISISTIRQKES